MSSQIKCQITFLVSGISACMTGQVLVNDGGLLAK